MGDEIDPVTLTFIIIYNSVILGMTAKWVILEMRKLMRKE
jgi:hypothetical protein